jgi:hypothetical protein
MKEIGVWSMAGMKPQEKNRSNQRKIFPRTTSPTKTPTRTGLVWNPALSVERPKTNALNRGTAKNTGLVVEYLHKKRIAKLYPCLLQSCSVSLHRLKHFKIHITRLPRKYSDFHETLFASLREHKNNPWSAE